VLDCTDNFSTRQAVNAACVRHARPLVSGAAIRMDGQVSVYDSRPGPDGASSPTGPCYACLFPPASAVDEVQCATMGVFAPLTGIVGTLQAAEALKLIGGFGEPLVGRLLLIDGRAGRFTEVSLPRNPQCAVCGGSSR